jgi:NAD(P)-dependent dehydrogenase (short-subunit alcohol dehydrogenase family)
MLLTHRVAVIYGASGGWGVGQSTARLFAEQGALVVILDADENTAQAAALRLGLEHLGFACDVNQRESCEAAAQRILAACGRVDVLVNNIAISPDERYLSEAFVPSMRARGQGSIAYMAASGWAGLTREMARELEPDNIRVNCIRPGVMRTGMAGEDDPFDIAGAFLFLASDLSAYLTGAVVDVDGGRLIH